MSVSEGMHGNIVEPVYPINVTLKIRRKCETLLKRKRNTKYVHPICVLTLRFVYLKI